MMYPRLKLARNLLRDDGLIFISIDDAEVCNLRRIMDDIFGEEHCVAQLVWKNKYNAGALTKGFSSIHEYILVYAKGELLT
jgi:adenine-specific DNA-methyltransferase